MKDLEPKKTRFDMIITESNTNRNLGANLDTALNMKDIIYE